MPTCILSFFSLCNFCNEQQSKILSTSIQISFFLDEKSHINNSKAPWLLNNTLKNIQSNIYLRFCFGKNADICINIKYHHSGDILLFDNNKKSHFLFQFKVNKIMQLFQIFFFSNCHHENWEHSLPWVGWQKTDYHQSAIDQLVSSSIGFFKEMFSKRKT